MKRMSLMILCCLTLALLLSAASADTVTMTPTFYNPANDITEWHLTRRDISDALIQELRGGTFFANLLPISEDLLLWYGTFTYHKLIQEESFSLSYDVDRARTDAYAVAVDSEGKRLWSLRLSDPQSENSFAGAWLLPDDRIMLWFHDAVGEWDTSYFIVSQEGEVQEMLPAFKAREYGVSEMLKPMHGGFFGGGWSFADGAFGSMADEVNFTFFDETMEMKWRNESEEYMPGSFEAYEVSDGILLAGSVTANLAPGQQFVNSPPQQVMTVSKLDMDGNTMWIFKGNEFSTGYASALRETEDGGAVFLTGYDPTKPTAYEEPVRAILVKLDRNGELVWQKQLSDHTFYSVPDLTPYGEGYLMLTYSYDDGDEIIYTALYVNEEGELLGTAVLDAGAEASTATFFGIYASLVSAPDGSVYLHGNTVEYEMEVVVMEDPQMARPFYVNMQDVFPLEQPVK